MKKRNLEIKYNNLLEKRDELKDTEEWLGEFKKKVTKLEKKSFIICTLMAIPFLAYGLCLIPETLAPLPLIVPAAIIGGTGMLVIAAFTILYTPILGSVKLINKLLLKNNAKELAKLKKERFNKIPTKNKNNNISSTQKNNSSKQISNNTRKPRTSTEKQKYSYKPNNSTKDFDPKQHIKIIDGKVVWLDDIETITNPKKRTLSK